MIVLSLYIIRTLRYFVATFNHPIELLEVLSSIVLSLPVHALYVNAVACFISAHVTVVSFKLWILVMIAAILLGEMNKKKRVLMLLLLSMG